MKFPLSLLIAATLAAPLAVQAADHHHEHGAPAAKATIELNAGKKWTTDAPLRQAMASLRTSATATLHKGHAGKATEADYDALSNETKAQLAYIVDNCKLDPKADAQLHMVLAGILDGAEVAKGKQPGKTRSEGVLQIVQGLNAYGKHFEHPGWKAIALAD